MTFAEFRALLDGPPPQFLRRGQHAYNSLFTQRPDLASLVCASSSCMDPYFADAALPLFWRFLEENW